MKRHQRLEHPFGTYPSDETVLLGLKRPESYREVRHSSIGRAALFDEPGLMIIDALDQPVQYVPLADDPATAYNTALGMRDFYRDDLGVDVNIVEASADQYRQMLKDRMRDY